VSQVSRWHQRFGTVRELTRFAVVGGIGVLVTDGVFTVMISEHQAAFTPNAVATLAASAVTFVGSRYWTFRDRERTGLGREAVTFIVLNLVSVLIQQACLELAARELGAGQDKVALNAAFLAGVGLATGFRFWSYRRYVWPARSGNGGNVGDVGLAARPECDLLAGGHDEDLAHAR